MILCIFQPFSLPWHFLNLTTTVPLDPDINYIYLIFWTEKDKNILPSPPFFKLQKLYNILQLLSLVFFYMWIWYFLSKSKSISHFKIHPPPPHFFFDLNLYIRVLWYYGSKIINMAAKIDWHSMWIHRTIESAHD
jgi:hypothetical protein